MLREEHYSHPEILDSWESIMPTLWRFEVRWSIFGLSPLMTCMTETKVDFSAHRGEEYIGDGILFNAV